VEHVPAPRLHRACPHRRPVRRLHAVSTARPAQGLDRSANSHLALLPRYPWHASCSIQWTFSSGCPTVQARLVAQLAAWEGPGLCPNTTGPECPAMPCGQNCLYTLVSGDKGKIVAEHQTPVAR
jgi:hypothetical protein